MTQRLKLLGAFLEVPATTWWLTAVYNGDPAPSFGLQAYLQTERSCM